MSKAKKQTLFSKKAVFGDRPNKINIQSLANNSNSFGKQELKQQPELITQATVNSTE
jgi:hypothetical protein